MTPLRSVWVCASAGTGKTRFLIERVLKLLLQRVPPERILCLTYTRAAAAEMISRIHQQLEGWVLAEERVLTERLAALLGSAPDPALIPYARRLFGMIVDYPGKLKIQTIHGFCQSLVQRFPFEANVAPGFEVMEEAAARRLMREAWHRWLAAEEGEALSLLATAIHETRIEEWLETLLQRDFAKFERLFHRYSFKEIKRQLRARLGVHEEATLAQITETLAPDPARSEALLQACRELESCGKNAAMLAEKMTAWLKQKISLEEYLQAFLTRDQEMAKRLLPKRILENRAFGPLLEEECRRVAQFLEQRKALQTALRTEALLSIVLAIQARYQEIKREKGVLDFHDLVHRALLLLQNEAASDWILFQLDGGIDHILVDEAQDTAPEQWLIVEALSREFFAGQGAASAQRTLTVVGDEKQSIYRFQGADAAMFAAMAALFKRKAAESPLALEEMGLHASYRSLPAILQAVDMVFAPLRQHLTKEGLPIGHAATRQDAEGKVELWPLVTAEEKQTFEPWPIPREYVPATDPKALLAEKIAAETLRWLSEKRMLPARGRAVRPGDIMILLRQRHPLMGHLLRALGRAGIPATADERLLLKEHIAVADLVKLASFLLLPSDDMALAVVLKSPLFGISEEALFDLAYGRGENTLRQRVAEHSPAMHGCLSRWIEQAGTDSPFGFFLRLLEEEGYRQKFIARLGKSASTALDAFLREAYDFEQKNPPSLQLFLSWFEQGKAEIRHQAAAKDEVRILTVHAAKGLQAPIVILPDTVHTPHKEHFLLWEEGLHALCFWPGRQTERDLYSRRLVEKEKQQDNAEYYRLLYVAMTRAEDELYIAGATGRTALPEGCWYQVIERAMRNLTVNTAQYTNCSS